MKPAVPDDALLWRVETVHTEVVCFVVVAPDDGVALCVERNEELTSFRPSHADVDNVGVRLFHRLRDIEA